MPDRAYDAESDYGRFAELATELGFEGKEASEYVDSHMERLGYTRTSSWVNPEPEGGDNVSGFRMPGQRGGKGARQDARTVRRETGQGRTASGGDWQYRG